MLEMFRYAGVRGAQGGRWTSSSTLQTLKVSRSICTMDSMAVAFTTVTTTSSTTK